MAKSKTTCPDECIGWTEARLDASLNESYYAHQASGAESVASHMRAKAGEIFARGPNSHFDNTDKIAGVYRDMAEFVENMAKEWRADQKKAQQRTAELDDGSND